MHIGVIGVNDILNPFGQTAHDIEMLGIGKTLHADRRGQQTGVGVEPATGDAVNLQGAQIEAQALHDAYEGRLGDEAEIDMLSEFFQIDIGQILQAKGQTQGVEFAFAVTAVYRGDIHGDMTFVIDFLLGRKCLRAENDFLSRSNWPSRASRLR